MNKSEKIIDRIDNLCEVRKMSDLDKSLKLLRDSKKLIFDTSMRAAKALFDKLIKGFIDFILVTDKKGKFAIVDKYKPMKGFEEIKIDKIRAKTIEQIQRTIEDQMMKLPTPTKTIGF